MDHFGKNCFKMLTESKVINLKPNYDQNTIKCIASFKSAWQLNENEYGSDIWSETSAPYVSYTSKIIVKTNILPILRMP